MAVSIPFVSTVCKAMERIAPLRLAETWDNVGLLLESPSQRLKGVNRVLLTIDLTTAVMDEALQLQTPVIISYHPPIFRGLKSFTLSNPLQASLLRCAAEGISVYAPHTAVDSVWGGVNDWLAEGILTGSEGDIGPAVKMKKSDGGDGESEGAEGRLVTYDDPTSLEVVVSRIKKRLGIVQLEVAYAPNAKRDVKSVAICAGSGGSMLVGRDADVYFTGEMQHHDVLASVAAGKHVVLCGHTNTERGYLPVLATQLINDLKANAGSEHLQGLEVLVSKKDVHPLTYV
ncbi:NGG1 interacting factor 3-like protein [Cylindrobasidium torrendii FP15055 ss-10]|uniref:NGG1 interacting factor 3-like protein n=1 Tax=Cylindrobasidium torrendii FP15055 ss-10 TaxID=1314674 RepID=A0A0D7BTZ3_9AGAR|nr:NGG1 interacting factor 3-like protein [Cylindrobasidium torrendii FP15055 ss-10]